MLPILNVDGRPRALAGMISDASLVDLMTVINHDASDPKGAGFRAGTVVVIDAVQNDNYLGYAPGDLAATVGKSCGVAVFSHYEMNEFAQSEIRLNGARSQRPCNVALTGRVWMLAVQAGIVANGRVDVAPVVDIDGKGHVVAGAVRIGSNGGIPGWFFTGRTTKDVNGFPVAEVHIRPQSAVAAAVVPVTGVTITEPDQALAAGAKFTFHAVVAPANATNQGVKWKSSATAVATVNANTGEVTAVSGATSGATATITATTDDGAQTATRVVTIS